MKKYIITLLTAALTACVLAVSGSAQVKITTKKMKLSDFPSKTTKVVLTGSAFYDEALKEEVSRHWRISPYEFCTMDEYEKLKSSTEYYFLAIMDSRMKKETEPGISVLTVFRGGSEDAGTEEGKPMEVATLPFGPADSPSGREFVFLPSLIEILQQYIDDSMTSDRTAYAGWGVYSKKYLKENGRTIYMAREDLCQEIEIDPEWEGKRILVMDSDDIDELFASGASDALMSYTVYPTDPKRGSACYKFLISPDTQELFYFSKHQISGLYSHGFLDKDMKLLSLTRKAK